MRLSLDGAKKTIFVLVRGIDRLDKAITLNYLPVLLILSVVARSCSSRLTRVLVIIRVDTLSGMLVHASARVESRGAAGH